MTELQMMLKHLQQPEYIHILINPLPLYATGIGLIALAVSLFRMHPQARVVALGIVLFGCASVWPVVYFGEAGYDRVYAMSNPAAQQWLDLHMKRGEQYQYLFYLTGLVAAAGIVAAWKWPRALQPLCYATLLIAAAAAIMASWISHAGGQVRHAEFREGPPPNPVAAEDRHQHGGGKDEHGEAGQEKGAAGAMDHNAMQQKTAESDKAKPMDHGSMPGMEMGNNPESKEQPMQHDAAMSPVPPTQEQLEASRLQLEASRLQLEASRKQLEAADGAKKQSPSPGPQQPQPSPSASDHQHKDDHDHQQ